EHRGACLSPSICVGKVEDEQVLRCRSRHHWMGVTVCKLKVVLQIRSTQHDAVEPVVVLEPSNLHEAKSLAVHTDRAVERADWSSDSELGWHDPELGKRSAISGVQISPVGRRRTNTVFKGCPVPIFARTMCSPRGVQKLPCCSPGPLREVETR